MVDQINALGGYVPVAAAAASNIAQKPVFKASAASETPVQTTGGIAVVSVRYTSPVLVIDPGTKVVVYEQRDPETGQVLNQYPSQKAVQQYQQADQQSGSPLNDQKISSSSTAQVTPSGLTPFVPAKVGLSTVITAGVTTGPQVEPAGNYTE